MSKRWKERGLERGVSEGEREEMLGPVDDDW